MMASLERAVSSLAMTPQELSRPEHRNLRWYLSDRSRRFALMLYRQLSQAQREALFRTESLRIPFRTLTPAQQAPVRAAFYRVIAQEQAFSDRMAKQLPPRLALSPPAVSQRAALASGEIRFQLMHVDGQLSLNLQFGKRLSPGIFVASFGTADRRLEPAHGNPYTGVPVPPTAALPAARAVRAAFAESAWPDRLRQMSAGSGLSVMADYYRVRPINADPVPPSPPGSGEAAAALDELCAPDGYMWWTKGKTLLVRKRDWFDQQRYEIPDRWLLAMAQRARQAPLTCADAIRVLDLTDEQILGLGILFTDHGLAWQFNRAEEIGGLREYLALVNTAPRKADGRIENTQTVSTGGTTGKGLALKYATMTPLQQHLARRFLTAQEYPISPVDPAKFHLFLFGAGHTPHTNPVGYQSVPFMLAWDDGGHEKISLGYSLRLPYALPDDRRDRTRLEVVP